MKKLFSISLYIILVLFSCTKFDEEQQETDLSKYPDQESWNSKMYFTHNDINRAVLEAGYVAKYYENKVTLLDEGVKVDFFSTEGEHKSVLYSKKGKVFDDSNNMIATDNVIVISDNGRRLYTEELHWDNKEQKIISKVQVLITTETDSLYGDSFISDPDLLDYEITNPRGSFDAEISIED